MASVGKGVNLRQLKIIRNLVGNATPEQMRFVDFFISKNLGLFMPAVGPCYYAISHDHTHPGYSFILNFDDHSEICVQKKSYTSQPGKLCAVSPDVPHHEILTDTFARYVAIMIGRNYFEQERSAYGIAAKKIFRGERYNVLPDLKFHLKDFMSEFENQLPGCEKLLDAAAVRITHTIIRSIYSISPKREESELRMNIDRVVEYIHSHYGEKLDIQQLAEIASFSTSHFTRVFKISLGKSPMTFLMDTRLEKARKLLMSGEFTVTEIAYKTGFSSSSHFSTQFFEKYQHTPREYRKILA